MYIDIFDRWYKKIVEEIKATHFRGNRIKIFEQNQYKGTTPTRNYGLLQVTDDYKYIANNDADDVWLDPKKLDKQISFLESNPNIAIVGGQYIGRTKHGDRSKFFDIGKRPLDHDDCLESLLDGVNPIGNASVLFRRELILKIGMYEDLVPLTEDMWFWYKAVLAGYKVQNMEDTFVLYNVSSNPNYHPAFPHLLKTFFREILKTRNIKNQ